MKTMIMAILILMFVPHLKAQEYDPCLYVRDLNYLRASLDVQNYPALATARLHMENAFLSENCSEPIELLFIFYFNVRGDIFYAQAAGAPDNVLDGMQKRMKTYREILEEWLNGQTNQGV